MADLKGESGKDERDKLLEKETTSEQRYEHGYLHTLKGVAGMFSSVLITATSITCVQLLERRIPNFELNTFRNTLPLVVWRSVLMLKRDRLCLNRSDMVPTVKYSIAVFFGSTVYFLAVPLLPAAAASCIMYTTNVLGCFVLFFLFHNEKIRLTTVFSAVICITGLVMVLQPGFGSKISKFYTIESESSVNATLTVHNDNVNHSQNKVLKVLTIDNSAVLNETELHHVHKLKSFLALFEDMFQPSTRIGQILGYSLAMMSGLGFAWSILILKQNNFIAENPPKVLFWVCFLNFVISIVLMFSFEAVVLPSNWFDVAMVIIHCIFATIMWPLYLISSKFVSGPLFSIIFTMEIVVMLISQYTVLSSILPGHRNWMEVVGVVLVMLGCSLSSLVEICTEKGTETTGH